MSSSAASSQSSASTLTSTPPPEEVEGDSARGSGSPAYSINKGEVELAELESESSKAEPLVTEAPVTERYLHLAGVSVALLFVMTVWFSATAVLPQLILLWKLNPSSSPWLTATVQIGFAVGAVALSIFSIPDRVAPRVLFLIGGLTAALFNGLITAWRVFPFVVVLRFLTGVSISFCYPPAMRILSTWFAADRGLAIGFLLGAFCLGSASPHLINGFQASGSWEIIIWATSGLAVVGAILGFISGKDGPLKLLKAKFKFKLVAKLFQDPGFLFPCLGYYGQIWESYAAWGWISRFYFAVLSKAYPTASTASNLSKASFLAFGLIFVGGIGAIVGGRIADRWDRPRLVIIGSAVSAVCSFTIGLVDFSPVGAGIIAMIWGLAINVDVSQYSAMITLFLRDKSLIGTALTLQTGTGFMISVISVFLVPILSPLLTWTWLFTILTPGPLFSIASMIPLILRQRKRDKASTEV